MLWEDEPAQLCSASNDPFHSSLFRSISARRHRCVRSCVHTCTPTPNGCLSSEAGQILKACTPLVFSLALRPTSQNMCMVPVKPDGACMFQALSSCKQPSRRFYWLIYPPQKMPVFKTTGGIVFFLKSEQGEKEAGNTIWMLSGRGNMMDGMDNIISDGNYDKWDQEWQWQ